MVVIFSIIFIVAAVSLYDYFTARRWQLVTSAVRNDLVFENRNQEYGAYVLRRDYDKRMVIILLSVIMSLGLAFSTYAFIKNMPVDEVAPPITSQETWTVPAPPEEEVPPPPKEELPPPTEETVAFNPPVVVDVEVDDQTPVDTEIENANVDTENREGEEVVWTIPDEGEEEVEVVERRDEEVHTFVDEEAKFPGSMQEYISRHYNVPPVAQEMGLQGKCYLKFVVERNGDISNVMVERGIPDCPECDQEAIRVLKAMPKWSPGKLNGNPVRTWCRVPVIIEMH